MPQKLIDQTTIQPDGRPGDDAFTAFEICNDNFEDAEARLVVLEAGGGEIGGRLDNEAAARTAADAALGARIDAEHSLITQETADRIAADTALSARILGKNLLINGGMGVFQRGTLANRPDGESYTVDRWSFASVGTGTSNWGIGTFTLSDSSPILPVPSPPRYWLGLNIAAGTNMAWLRQKIEKVAVYANGKATLSFWMRSGIAGKKVGVRIIQDFGGGTGASAAVSVEGAVFTLTTSFQKYTYTFDVPSLVGKTLGSAPTNTDCLQVVLDFAATSGYGGQLVGQTGLFEMTQIQFERGAVATDFEQRPDAVELALCKRYYQKSFPARTAPAQGVGGYNLVATAYQSSVARASLDFSTTMRATPGVTIYRSEALSGNANSAALFNPTAGSWVASDSPSSPGVFRDNGFHVDVISPFTLNVPGAYLVALNWTADAEL